MKRYKSMTPRILMALAVAMPVMACVGCNSFNDNPVDADQMAKIRANEANDRANFNPSTTPPPAKK